MSFFVSAHLRKQYRKEGQVPKVQKSEMIMEFIQSTQQMCLKAVSLLKLINCDKPLLIFLSSGETEWCKSKRIQGHSNVQLNAKGRMQTQWAAKHLKNEPFQLAFTSDFDRAKNAVVAILEQNEVNREQV